MDNNQNSLLALLKHRPRLVLGGVWGSLIALAAIAVLSLMNTGRVEEQQEIIPTLPVPETARGDAAWLENPAKTSSQAGSPMRLWLLGAVALTCAGGSLVIYKRLNRSSQPRQLCQRAQPSSAPVLTRRRVYLRRRLEPLVLVSAPVQPSVPAETEPVGSVLSLQESQPLDSGCESLAEMMDIRKQRSLSSILEDL